MKKISILLFMACIGFSVISCSKPDRVEETGDPQQLVPPTEIPLSSSASYPRLLHTQEQIVYVREKLNNGDRIRKEAYDQVIAIANSFLLQSEHAEETLFVPLFYEDTPGHRAAKNGVLRDSHAAYTCALVYVLSGDTKYADKAIYFLNAWAKKNKVISTTGDSRLIGAYGMIGFLVAADLLMGHAIWNDADKQQFRDWLQNVYLPPVATIKAWEDNKGDWGTYAVASAYHLLGDEVNLSNEIARVKIRISQYIASNGHMPKEVARGVNGLWYTYFALTPMTLSARLALNTGDEDIFNYQPENAGSIKQALDYLYYYAQRKNQWPHHTMPAGGPQNGDWPVALFEAMNDFYNNEYGTFVAKYRPIKDGYDGVNITHSGWFYPTLFRIQY